MNNSQTLLFLPTIILTTCLSLTAIADNQSNAQSTALSTAHQFSEALASGNEASVMNLLANDVLIYESGGVENSLEEYASHHLAADIKFLSAMTKKLISEKVFTQGDLAIVTSLSQLTGTYRDKPIDSKSTETLVLKRTDNAWKIVHIHWSSR